MGVVNTTYTFTGTDTITSSKLNNIIDDTTFTSDAISGSSLQIVSPGKLAVAAGGITSNELANDSVTSAKIVDGTIVNADINASAAIAGTKIVSQFGTQGITATGNLGLYGSSSNYTAAALVNTSGVETQLYSNGSTNGGLSTITNHPLILATNNAERMRITASGNVGVGTGSPNVKFDIVDTGYPSAKIKSSYTATGLTYSSLHFGDQVANQGGDCGFVYNSATPSSSFFHWTPFGAPQGVPFKITSSGLVGINLAGTPTTALQVGGTVTATAFSGPLTGNVTGNVTGSASTVSDSAITAAKLNGNQSGSAPIYGCRAWVTFDMTRDASGASNTSNTNRYIYSSGNVSSVTKTADGSFTVNFTTAMPNANYAFFGGGRGNDSKGDIIIGEALLGAKSTSSIELRCVDSGNNDRNSSEISVAFIG